MKVPILCAVCALGLATAGCSREAPQPAQPSPPGDGPAMTPAAGQTPPQVETPRRGCEENFHAFDDDGNGRVSLAEFTARPHVRDDPAGVFRTRDSDGDGSLSETEFCADWRRGPAQGAGPRGATGPRFGRGDGWGRRRLPQPMMGTGCEQRFAAFDSDSDGKVTKEEFLAWPHAQGDAETIFGERDRDHDGSLTRDEFCTPRTK